MMQRDRTERDPAHFIFVVSQRHRGVWLAHYSESSGGTEEWDAFPTLAAAKRWCAEAAGRKRLEWQERTGPNQWPRYIAELGTDG